MRFREFLARLLPLFLLAALTVAAPAWGGGNSQGDNNNSQGDNQDGGGRGPAVPEPAGWLAMGAGLLVVGLYARNRFRSRR